MVYIEISGLRLSQAVLLAILESTVAYLLLLLLLILVHVPHYRPRDVFKLKWIPMWRAHTTLYVIFATMTEAMWVQYSLLSDTKNSAVGCPWSQPRLAVWAGVQIACLIRVLSCFTFFKRESVAENLNGIIGMHSMGIMSIAMLSMYEEGSCLTLVFPFLSGSIGMIVAGCCVPWFTGAWSVSNSGDVSPDFWKTFTMSNRKSNKMGVLPVTKGEEEEEEEEEETFHTESKKPNGKDKEKTKDEDYQDVSIETYDDTPPSQSSTTKSEKMNLIPIGEFQDEIDVEAQLKKRIKEKQKNTLTCFGWFNEKRRRKKENKELKRLMQETHEEEEERRDLPIMARDYSESEVEDSNTFTSDTSQDEEQEEEGEEVDNVFNKTIWNRIKSGPARGRKNPIPVIKHVGPPSGKKSSSSHRFNNKVQEAESDKNACGFDKQILDEWNKAGADKSSNNNMTEPSLVEEMITITNNNDDDNDDHEKTESN